VQPQGALGELPNGMRSSSYGTLPWLQPIAVTNERGEFELTSTRPFDAMVLQAEARGLASRIFTSLASGTDRHTLTMTEGGVIRGRLVRDGKPVADAEIGLVATQRGWGANLKLVGCPLPETTIGSNADGTFAITNVTPDIDWYLYGKMESLGPRAGAPNIEIRSGKDGQEVNASDLPMETAFHLRGRVVLSDGQQIPKRHAGYDCIGPRR
jgi:hypothetical protein